MLAEPFEDGGNHFTKLMKGTGSSCSCVGGAVYVMVIPDIA